MPEVLNKEKLLEQAKLFADQGKLDRAIQEYIKVLQMDPKDLRLKLRVAELYVKTKNQWIVGAALHRRIVGDDQYLSARHTAHSGHHAGTRGIIIIAAQGRKCREFQKRRTGIQKRRNTIPREHLATIGMAFGRDFAATIFHHRQRLFEGRHLRFKMRHIFLKFGGLLINMSFDDVHGGLLCQDSSVVKI